MTAAAVEMKGNDFAKAEDYLNRAISANPRSSKARLALGQVQEMHLKNSMRPWPLTKSLSACRPTRSSMRACA
ncbi:MAG: tetratricopeptide repeat protein [Calothrix sp. SM1_5_4]|nr:tetratricopeptide repeat protein [Calothrix sp. SM1_5_4]